MPEATGALTVERAKPPARCPLATPVADPHTKQRAALMNRLSDTAHSAGKRLENMNFAVTTEKF